MTSMSEGHKGDPGSLVSFDPKALLGIAISSQWVKIHRVWNHLHSYMGKNFENKLFPLTLPGKTEIHDQSKIPAAQKVTKMVGNV